MSIEKRIEKLTAELERTKLDYPGGRKAYYAQLYTEQKQSSEATFKILCNNVGLEPSVVRQEAHDTNNSLIGVLCKYMGLEVREFDRLLMERRSNSRR